MEEDILTGTQTTYNPFLNSSDFVPYTQSLSVDSELTYSTLNEIVRSTGISLLNSSTIDKKAILIDFIREMQVTNKIKLSAFSMIRNKIEELW